jgi:hypothetical protein
MVVTLAHRATRAPDVLGCILQSLGNALRHGWLKERFGYQHIGIGKHPHPHPAIGSCINLEPANDRLHSPTSAPSPSVGAMGTERMTWVMRGASHIPWPLQR